MRRASDRMGASPTRRGTSGAETKAAKRSARPRLSSEARQQLILTEAIRFFAEEGFEGQTRALAQRLGITHSLLYRHFADKDALIERVYREVYLGRWRPAWRSLLDDRSRPLADRLKAFYGVYTKAIFDRHWVRIFIFAGLKRVDINRRYMALIERQVLRPLCLELRAEAGLGDADSRPIAPEELEMVWGLHGRIFSLAIRKWVYGAAMPIDLDATIAGAIDIFLHGALPSRAGARLMVDGVGPRLGRPKPPAIGIAALPVAPPKPGRRRMLPEDRERHIVAAAIGFFAEHGFEGQMRELARRAGMTHSLLYRYFATKEALIERVYDEVYAGRWQPGWDALLRDPTIPIESRLVRFYCDYARATDDYDWMRIFMHAGLKGVSITRRYLALVRRRIVVPVARALRLARDPSADAGAALSSVELEAAWGLHEQIVYVMIRRWVYGLGVPENIEAIIATAVSAFTVGAPMTLQRLDVLNGTAAPVARRAAGGRIRAELGR